MSDKPINHKLYSAGCSGTIKGSGKDVNEDFTIFYEKEPEGNIGAGNFYVIADGVSGTYRPEVSATFVGKKVLYDYFRSREYAEANKIAIAIRNANHELYHYAQAQHQEMQSVVAAVSIVEGRAVIGTIGDCSVFILRAGVAYKMTEEQVSKTDDDQILVHTLGETDDIIVDILDAIELKSGDILIISSDGMANYAGKKEFLEAAMAEHPKEICRRLLEEIEPRKPVVDVSVLVVKIYDENTVLSVVRQPGTAPERVEVGQVAQDLKFYQATHAQPAVEESETAPVEPRRLPLRILAGILIVCIIAALIWFIGDSNMGGKIFAPRDTATPTIDAVQATLSSINATKEAELILQLSFTPTATIEPTATATPSPLPPTETPEPTETIEPTPDIVGAVPENPQIMVSDKDNAELVFVPAGVFLFGADSSDGNADQDEKPRLSVYLDDYWIDRMEVTNAQYSRCVEAGVCETNGTFIVNNPLYGDHPVMSVTFDQAQQYCKWAGRRLPTEFEWEKAARGIDGRLYPWGDEAPTAQNHYANTPLVETIEGAAPDDYGIYPVGTFPKGASPYGALDMSGNVWEWTSSLYRVDAYSRLAELADSDGIVRNPEDLTEGAIHVKRGGSASFSESYFGVFMRTTQRWGDNIYENDYLGFRCALPGR